ncbi:SGNH/GDSL hydrolase family protein [Arthrobacter tecti]
MTDGMELELSIRTQGQANNYIDLLIDGALTQRVSTAQGVSTITFDLSKYQGVHRLQAWLPHLEQVDIGSALVRGATVMDPARLGLNWITYGSSITHCSNVPGPSETWPALVSRQNDWNLTCLGFGGQCHLDPVVARTIGQTPADLISLCLGINIYGSSSIGDRALVSQLCGFIQTVRDRHPSTPILVISPIASPDREDARNLNGLSLQEVRQRVHDATTILTNLGDQSLHYVDGREILGAAEAELLPDGLHPNAVGYQIMAHRLGKVLRDIAFSSGMQPEAKAVTSGDNLHT